MYEALSVARSSTDLAARGSQQHPTMANSKIEDVMRISANLSIISPERGFPGRFNFRSGCVPTAFVGAGTFWNWYISRQPRCEKKSLTLLLPERIRLDKRR